MTGIWDFPELRELREFFVEGIEIARQDLAETVDEEDREIFLSNIVQDDIVVVEEWGRGTAEVGSDQLEFFVFFDVEQTDRKPHLIPEFDPAVRGILQRFLSLINEGELVPPEESFDWFPNVDPIPQAVSRWDDQISLALGDSEGNTVFNLTQLRAIEFREEQSVDEMPRLSIEELRTEEEEEAEGPEEEDTEEFEVAEEEIPLQAPQTFKDAQLIPWEDEFNIIDDHIQIPAGSPTKKVELRELYDFELRMGLTSQSLGDLEDFRSADRLTNGIGFAMELGRVGNTEPAANFPRTSSYIKNRLMFEGVEYILGLYNDLVIYSGFISSFYDMELRPGSYKSFREFIYRLRQIDERGGPKLIEKLSQQQAAQRGLKTIPDHPTIDGADAPWLENRTYYSIVEENTDHEAWDNPTEFLYEELGEAEQE